MNTKTASKVALVTGAGKRLGRAFAIHLAKREYDIAVHYFSSDIGARETAEEIKAIGRRAVLFSADLSKLSAPKKLVQDVREEFGRLDLLFNSASTFPEPNTLRPKHDIELETEEEWEQAIAVNLQAPFFLTKYAVPLLRQSDNGIIINVLDHPSTARAAHTISKQGLKALSELSEKTFSKNPRAVSLLLENVIPGEEMTEEDIARLKWTGVEKVLIALDEILNDRSVSSISVSE